MIQNVMIIKELRQNLGLTFGQAGTICNLNPFDIRKIEAGKIDCPYTISIYALGLKRWCEKYSKLQKHNSNT